MSEVDREAIEQLSRDITQLRKDLKRNTQELTAKTRSNARRTRVLIICTIVFALGSSAVVYDNRQSLAASNRKLCPILTVGVPRPGSLLKPSTTYGTQALNERLNLAAQFHCPLP